MRITIQNFKGISAFLLGAILIVASQISCNVGVMPTAEVENQPEEPIEPEVPAEEGRQPEEPLPVQEEPHILRFVAHQTELQPGECTGLEWQVEGGFGVELDGQPVRFADGMDICPPETTSYHLVVDGGDRIVEAEVIVHVLVSSEEQPSPGEGYTQPTATQLFVSQGPAATSKPPTKAPVAPTN